MLSARPPTSAETWTPLSPLPGSDAHDVRDPNAGEVPYSNSQTVTSAPCGLTTARKVAECFPITVGFSDVTVGLVGGVLNSSAGAKRLTEGVLGDQPDVVFGVLYQRAGDGVHLDLFFARAGEHLAAHEGGGFVVRCRCVLEFALFHVGVVRVHRALEVRGGAGDFFGRVGHHVGRRRQGRKGLHGTRDAFAEFAHGDDPVVVLGAFAQAFHRGGHRDEVFTGFRERDAGGGLVEFARRGPVFEFAFGDFGPVRVDETFEDRRRPPDPRRVLVDHFGCFSHFRMRQPRQRQAQTAPPPAGPPPPPRAARADCRAVPSRVA